MVGVWWLVQVVVVRVPGGGQGAWWGLGLLGWLDLLPPYAAAGDCKRSYTCFTKLKTDIFKQFSPVGIKRCPRRKVQMGRWNCALQFF